MRTSENVLAALGISEPDVELAKADLAARIHRLLEQRRISPEEAAALLSVTASELPALLQGRLATCSLDQLLRVLTWLGDDVEILIRPRLRQITRGTVRVLQAAAIERAEHFENGGRAAERRTAGAHPARPSGDENAVNKVQSAKPRADERQMLNKWRVEELTSLDITTIYRKMKLEAFLNR